MNDYIKREDAVKIINSLPWTSSADHTRKKNLILLFTLYEAADVVEVVRCKDCKNYRKDIPCVGGQYNGCVEWLDEGCEAPVEEDDYCSYGERKEA